MTQKQIDEVLDSKLDSMADPDCEHCLGTGLVSDGTLEGQNIPCLCIEEWKAQLQAESLD